MIWLNFGLYMIENSCLVLVSYVANWENYRKYQIEIKLNIRIHTKTLLSMPSEKAKAVWTRVSVENIHFVQ